MHRLAHPDGELATSRAAASQNIAMALSSYSTESLEDVKAQAGSNPYAMQLCVLRDRYTTKQILERAEAAGYSAIFLSVDVPLLGRRLNEFRNDFQLPDGMEWPNLLSNGKAELNQELNDHTQETRSYEFGLYLRHCLPEKADN
jgi:(S)-2-hydroxy-acid oxidase